MVASMTGFGRAAGVCAGLSWQWEARSVNGRGLEVKFRLPPGWDGVEPGLRAEAGQVLRRGNVQAVLSVKRAERAEPAIDRTLLESLLAEAQRLAARIEGAPAPRAELLLGLPGVLRREAAEELAPEAEQVEAVVAGFTEALHALATARLSEGARIGAVVAGQVDVIAGLVQDADNAAAAQPAAAASRLRAAVAKLSGEAGVNEDRLTQEIALLATRSDVREELDRLESHIAAARAILAESGAMGRQLDFLVQEFVREANTLCSKSASTALTAVGLKLKYVIEQFREQVQNLE